MRSVQNQSSGSGSRGRPVPCYNVLRFVLAAMVMLGVLAAGTGFETPVLAQGPTTTTDTDATVPAAETQTAEEADVQTGRTTQRAAADEAEGMGLRIPPPPPVRRTLESTWDRLKEYAPSILLALAVLVIGTLLAWIVGGILHWLLDRFSFNRRLKSCMPEEGESPKKCDSSRWISMAVFCVLELFVLVTFFQVLKFTPAEQSLNRVLERIFDYIPRLLGAGIILLVAWIVAGILRYVITRVMSAAKVDEWLRRRAGEPEEGEAKWSLTQSLGQIVYWLTLILFLPAVFDALAIEGLRNPMSQMLDKVLTYLPNVLLAAIILVVGWWVARIVQRILANLLAAVGVNALAERVGLHKALGKKSLAEIIALVVYVLILVPVVIASLNALEVEGLTSPASAMLESFLAAIPLLFAAALILAVAFIAGRLLARLTTSLLEAIGFDQLPAKLGLGQVTQAGGEKNSSLSKVCGYIVLVAVMLFASLAALRQLEWTELADIVHNFLRFVGDVALAVVVLGLGLYLAQLAARAIRSTQVTYAGALALVARVAVIVVASAMALERIGVGESIVQTAFTLTLAALAVAAAVAFGIGGRDVAKRRLEEWDAKMRQKKE